MLDALTRILADWSDKEPSASLFVFAVAVLLFGATFTRLRSQAGAASPIPSPYAGAWLAALGFVGAVGFAYFLLYSSYMVFQPVADLLARGDEIQRQIHEAQKTWGRPVSQDELTVSHTRSYVVVEEVPTKDGEETKYINRTVVETVEQDSLEAFFGEAIIRRVDPVLNTYEAEANFEYTVVNQSEYETIAHFSFPMTSLYTFDRLLVTLDGKDIGSQKRWNQGRMEWEISMRPHETIQVAISYRVRGMGSFHYEVPVAREIRDFSFSISVDTRSIYSSTVPDSTAIAYLSEPAGDGYRLTWKIDRAIMAPTIGVLFQSAPITDEWQLGAIWFVRYTPRGSMLFAVVFVLTLVICGISFEPMKFVFLLGLYSFPFLAIMGFSLLGINYLAVLIVASVLAFLLFLRLFRGFPRLPLILASALLLLLMLGYPFAGFLNDGPDRNAFDTAVQVGTLMYGFGLALYIRVKKALSG